MNRIRRILFVCRKTLYSISLEKKKTGACCQCQCQCQCRCCMISFIISLQFLSVSHEIQMKHRKSEFLGERTSCKFIRSDQLAQFMVFIFIFLIFFSNSF